MQRRRIGAPPGATVVERLCCVMTSKPSQDAHGDLYSATAAWYVRTFYDDLSDSALLASIRLEHRRSGKGANCSFDYCHGAHSALHPARDYGHHRGDQGARRYRP
jgi:hypothetical protein